MNKYIIINYYSDKNPDRKKELIYSVKKNLSLSFIKNVIIFLNNPGDKKDLINSVYMQIGFSKNISENLIDDFLSTILENLKSEKKLKLSKFGTFSIRTKKSRIGRNPKTKEEKTISDRDVVLFKASKEFKDLVNSKNDS